MNGNDRRRRRVVTGLALAGTVIVLRPGTSAHRFARRQVHALGRWVRFTSGRLSGLGYRLRGGHPDPDVTDDVLADRIRSSIGVVEKRLDIPHVLVTVNHHTAVLHGVVGSEADEREITDSVAAVSGVHGVESRLHIGLDDGMDTRPSVGRAVAAHQHPAPAS